MKHVSPLPFVTRAFRIGITAGLLTVRHCPELLQHLNYGAPTVLCFRSNLPESLCFLFRTFLAIFFIRTPSVFLPGQGSGLVFRVPSRSRPEPHSVLYVDSANGVDCLEVHSLSRKTGTCTHLFSKLSSITDTFGGAHCSLDFFLPIRSAESIICNLYGVGRV